MSKAFEDVGFIRNASLGQYFVTAHGIWLAGLGCAGSCREYRSPRDDKGSKPKGLTQGNTKNCTVLEVNVTNHLERHGIEMKIDSLQKHGTQSWIVISRCINKYVTELRKENKKPVQCEEVQTSEGELVVMKQKEQ